MPVSRLLSAVTAAAKDVAAVEVMPRYLKVGHSRKSDGSLCTEADTAAQAALERVLRRIAPYPVLGEEMSDELQRQRWDEGRDGLWCVDPVDGTSNFVNGLPYFAVSIALLKNYRPVLGVIYAPVSQELFYAEKDGGAYLNGAPIVRRRAAKNLRNALAGVEFKRINKDLARKLAFAPPYSSQRNLGASTLDWCYLAAGRFDVYLHGGQKLWDYAAGCLILEESGGAIATIAHDDFWAEDVWLRQVVAAVSGPLVREWLDWLRAPL